MEALLHIHSGVIVIARPKTTLPGGFMTDQQEPIAKSSHLDVEQSSRSIQDCDVRRQGILDNRTKEDYEVHVRSLQQYICELLISNQKLRWSLEAATNQRCENLSG
jgi:hypothetical protein